MAKPFKEGLGGCMPPEGISGGVWRGNAPPGLSFKASAAPEYPGRVLPPRGMGEGPPGEKGWGGGGGGASPPLGYFREGLGGQRPPR